MGGDSDEWKAVDANNAAVSMAYKMSNVCFIYPITPSSPMGQYADVWYQQKKENVFGEVPVVRQMQSEAGASGSLHGAACTGALTSTFTCSQGLLLMIPNMFKLAGEMVPCVFHVAARTVASNAMNIFCDHSDVMACRQTGFAILNATSVQESVDMAAIAHLASAKASLPFLHFFDGMRTSHEVNKIQFPSDETLTSLFDYKAISEWRNARTLANDHPTAIGGVCGSDTHWQTVETTSPIYAKLPGMVQEIMDAYGEKTGRKYRVMEYVGHPEAETCIVQMGSGATTTEEAMNYLLKNGERVGLLKVRLFRPWSDEMFLEALPKTVKRLAVLDRTLQLGASHEPLFLSVAGSLSTINGSRSPVLPLGGCYGIGGKEYNPAHSLAVYANLSAENPKLKFGVGIDDDVNHMSLPIPEMPETVPEGTVQSVCFALGADGTVGANKNAIAIIGENTDMYAQGYFNYDAKKSGGFTISHMRFGPKPLSGAYEVYHASYVGCHQASLLRKLNMTRILLPNGNFALNAPWITLEQLEKNLPSSVKKSLADKNAALYVIDAEAIAEEVGLKGRINMVMNTVFFKLANVLPMERALELLKDAVVKTYTRIGKAVVEKNHAAIDKTLEHLVKIEIPAGWKDIAIEADTRPGDVYETDVLYPAMALEGANLPVSKFLPQYGGIVKIETTQYEKRQVTNTIPVWDSKKCIECNMCVGSCPHAVIRPFSMNDDEKKNSPEPEMDTLKLKGIKGGNDLQFRIQLSAIDCVGCGACVDVCPKDALTFKTCTDSELQHQQKIYDYCRTSLADRRDLFDFKNYRSALFKQPLIEFTAACGGCAEVPYTKLLTQMFGEDMLIANTCGCSMVWGGYHPSSPWVKTPEGRGPVYCGTLFEDGAENGVGMGIAAINRRERLIRDVNRALSPSANIDDPAFPPEMKDVLKAWQGDIDDRYKCHTHYSNAKKIIDATPSPKDRLVRAIYESIDLLSKRVVWVIGGDGWAYDIGYGGLDHVLGMGVDMNVLVMDTEVYSNTGGQRSKATPRGAVAGFASKGSPSAKKDMGVLAMQAGGCYVASISLAANPKQAMSAMQEAEAFPGPSLVLAYSPCIAHGLSGGQGTSPTHQKLAVETGYWPLYRFDPSNTKKPFTMDSKPPKKPLEEFLKTETRFMSLRELDAELAKELQDKLQEDVTGRLKTLEDIKKMHEPKPKA